MAKHYGQGVVVIIEGLVVFVSIVILGSLALAHFAPSHDRTGWEIFVPSAAAVAAGAFVTVSAKMRGNEKDQPALNSVNTVTYNQTAGRVKIKGGGTANSIVTTNQKPPPETPSDSSSQWDIHGRQ